MLHYWKFSILLIVVTSCQVKSSYILEVAAFDYNHLSGQCITCRRTSAESPGCCDNHADKSATCEGEDVCDSGFIYCLRPLGMNSQPEADMSRQYLDGRGGLWSYAADLCLSTTAVQRGHELQNNTMVDFGVFNYVSRTVVYNHSYQGIQIVIFIYDVNTPPEKNDLIDMFFVDITSSPGVQLPLQKYQGIYKISQASFSFKIVCASGFYGPDCSTRCAGSIQTDCVGCKSGYYGQFCSIRQGSCELNRCYGNGNCLQNGTCVCNEDYSGQFCQTKIDNCVNVDCGNGTCVDGINSYNCSCPSDFTGPHCDLTIDSCQLERGGSPCAANSQCVDQVGGFKCVCGPDFTGQLCDVRIDNCVGVVCTGAKTRCVDELDSFRCDCKEGYTGESCDILVNSARGSKPCVSQTLFIGVVSGVGVAAAIISAILTACIAACIKRKRNRYNISHPVSTKQLELSQNVSVNPYVNNNNLIPEAGQDEDLYDNVDLF